MSTVVDRLEPDDWRRFRAIRLRALEDAPDAFGSTLARERAFEEADWRHRLRPGCVVAVVSLDGVDVAIAGGAPFEGRAGLFGVWAAPESRGRGAARAACVEVIDWARGAGYSAIALDVGDDNAPAIALYEALGFERTGRRGTLPPPRQHVTEHERVLTL